jgi:phosphotransferase system HPr-like phosphotransfer protein
MSDHQRAWLSQGSRSQKYTPRLVADGRSVINILILCASLGTTLEIEASGPGEREAIQALDAFSASSN